MELTSDEPSTITLRVGPLSVPTRLDVWLAAGADGQIEAPASRSRYQALIRAGRVALGGELAVDPKRRITEGDTLTLIVPPPEPAAPLPEAIPLAVLFEDDDLIVVNKPAGMVVHPGAGVYRGTLVNAVLHHARGTLSGIGGVARPGIVHRLDRDTSGVMVVAKNDAAHQHLSAQFADHGRTGPLERTYLALVWGRPTPSAGSIDRPLGRDRNDRTKRAVSNGSDARNAITHYRTEAIYEPASLVRCRLETGRTHQIRVHMASIGHPLLGDRTYGAAFRTKIDRLVPNAREALLRLEGQALHAATLRFAHPATGVPLSFEASPPPAMADLIEALSQTT